MKTKPKPKGRPPKPEAERFVPFFVRMPPALWRLIAETIPTNERSGWARGVLEKALRARLREAAKRERVGGSE